MNIALWIAQALLAGMFALAGFMKLTRSKEQLREQMAWVEDFSPGVVKMIAAFELLGAAGLILPGVTDIAPVLVPWAATGLVIIMLGAIATHIRRREYPMVAINLVLGGLALFVAWGRFTDWPL